MVHQRRVRAGAVDGTAGPTKMGPTAIGLSLMAAAGWFGPLWHGAATHGHGQGSEAPVWVCVELQSATHQSHSPPNGQERERGGGGPWEKHSV
jgi:hypothetical protein